MVAWQLLQYFLLILEENIAVAVWLIHETGGMTAMLPFWRFSAGFSVAHSGSKSVMLTTRNGPTP